MSGGVFVDKTGVRDAITASLETEPTDPIYPCPDCGSETRPHGEAPRDDSTDRICSASDCRTKQPAPPEVPRSSPSDERPRFPCQAMIDRDGKGEAPCGRETKLIARGKTGVTTKRICSRPDCRRIVETAS